MSGRGATKQIAAITLALVYGLGVSCGRGSPQEPLGESRLQVYVHWGDTGLAEKRVKVLELGVVRLTDKSGIAEFLVPAGTYTLRAYGINVPGPPPTYVDITVKTTRGETTRVEVVDCLPCVAANQGG